MTVDGQTGASIWPHVDITSPDHFQGCQKRLPKGSSFQQPSSHEDFLGEEIVEFLAGKFFITNEVWFAKHRKKRVVRNRWQARSREVPICIPFLEPKRRKTHEVRIMIYNDAYIYIYI